VKRHGGDVEIVVADTGSGISELHLARLFEPFFTTKEDVGTGLGLWVSKGIVEKHNGSIAVSSQTATEPGTVFTVSLPTLKDPEGAANLSGAVG
jgi:signal transduction histidine kinase